MEVKINPSNNKEYYFSAPTSPSQYYSNNGHDFAFDLNHDSEKEPSSAEDLFDGGVIKPLNPPPPPPRRGRAVSKSSSPRAARSLSPVRDNRVAWEEEDDEKEQTQPAKGQKKWRLRDLFLFRSASEGRAADKDPLRKYTARATGSRRRGPVSAHEVHYVVNRAVSEDLKRKSFLPYKQGILGRLAFNPAGHALANGFGFSRNK